MSVSNSRLAPAQEPPERRVQGLAPQVQQGHIHRRLGGGVVDHGALQFLHHRVQVHQVHADDGRGDEVPDGAGYGALRLPGDDGGGRRLAIALQAVFPDHPHHHVVDVLHCAQGGLEGMGQGEGYVSHLDLPNTQDVHLQGFICRTARSGHEKGGPRGNCRGYAVHHTTQNHILQYTGEGS